MATTNSYSQILRSLTLIGGSSIFSVALGLVKIKVAAMLLGPAGLGFIGLAQSVVLTASSIFSLGLSNAGTRKIAEADHTGDNTKIAAAAIALLTMAIALSLLGCIAVFFLREPIARLVFSEPSSESTVGWLSIGVALTIASGAQNARLNGLRRISDLARIAVLSALVSTIIAACAVWFLRERGLLLFVLSAPVAAFACGHWYVRKLSRPVAAHVPRLELVQQWKGLARLGAAFMISGLAGSLAQLAAKSLIGREVGPDAVGQFQASWTIGMTYIGFVLTSMGTDFYPRLSATIDDAVASNHLINQQTEVALLISGPVFLGMLAFTPWVVQLLYSRDFAEAAHLLRWQILGDVLKVASWPMGFILIAKGNGRDFMLTEMLVNGVFVLLVWIGLPQFGVNAAAIAFVGMYATLLPLTYALAKHRTGFRWETRVWLYGLSLFVFVASAFFMGRWSEHATQASAGTGALIFGLYGLGRLGEMIRLPEALDRLSFLIRNSARKSP